jgi:hypothetical protein
MLRKMFNLIWFGCRHSRITKPFYIDRSPLSRAPADIAADIPRHCTHYVVCLDCGRRFGYDWSEMKVIKTPLHKAG